MAADQLTSTFAALADPTRRAILARRVQAVSKHLRVLERAGLITRGRSAQLRPSRLHGAPLHEAADWLEDYRRFWQGSFDRLGERLESSEQRSEDV